MSSHSLFLAAMCFFTTVVAQSGDLCIPGTAGCTLNYFQNAQKKKQLLQAALNANTLAKDRYDLTFTTPGCQSHGSEQKIIEEPEKCTLNYWLESAILAIVSPTTNSGETVEWSQIDEILTLFDEGLIDPTTNTFFNRPSALQFAAFYGAPWLTVHTMLSKRASRNYVCYDTKIDGTTNQPGRVARNLCSMPAVQTALQGDNVELSVLIQNYNFGDIYVAPTEKVADTKNTDTVNSYFLIVTLSFVGGISFLIIFAVLYTRFTYNVV